jgi:hypothetical protein
VDDADVAKAYLRGQLDGWPKMLAGDAEPVEVARSVDFHWGTYTSQPVLGNLAQDFLLEHVEAAHKRLTDLVSMDSVDIDGSVLYGRDLESEKKEQLVRIVERLFLVAGVPSATTAVAIAEDGVILRLHISDRHDRGLGLNQLLPGEREGSVEDESEQQWGDRLGISRDSVTKSYAQLREELAAHSDASRKKIAAVLEPALNAKAAMLPHATYDEKKTLAKWANAELRRFGLAIRCPRTGKACLLMGNPGGQPGKGRFVLEYTDESGKRHHPFTSVTLPHLELTLDDLTRASYRATTQGR